jgi:hypothetical protein
MPLLISDMTFDVLQTGEPTEGSCCRRWALLLRIGIIASLASGSILSPRMVEGIK